MTPPAEEPRRVRTWIAAAGAVFVGWVVLHLPATDATQLLVNRVGFARYDQIMLAAATIVGAAVIATLWRHERQPLWHSPTLVASLALLGLACAGQRWLVVAPVEFVHYPQYALLAFLLARGLPCELAWIAATFLGAVDEAHQLLFLRRGRPDYFDWNDVCLNAIGAGIGVLLAMSQRRTSSRVSLTGGQVALACFASLVAAVVAQPPQFSPYLTPTPRGATWRILSAGEAVVLLAVIWMVLRWAIAGRRGHAGRVGV